MNCKPGQYGKNGQCFPCPLNTYQSEEGQNTCLGCPGNSSTAQDGADDISLCLGGYKSILMDEALSCNIFLTLSIIKILHKMGLKLNCTQVYQVCETLTRHRHDTYPRKAKSAVIGEVNISCLNIYMFSFFGNKDIVTACEEVILSPSNGISTILSGISTRSPRPPSSIYRFLS